MKTRLETVLENWTKIKKYCKDTYSGKMGETRRFAWKHEVYGRTEFCIDNAGNCWIEEGSHGWTNDNFYDSPYHVDSPKYRYPHAQEQLLVNICNDWQSIKKILNKFAEKEDNLNNFVV